MQHISAPGKQRKNHRRTVTKITFEMLSHGCHGAPQSNRADAMTVEEKLPGNRSAGKSKSGANRNRTGESGNGPFTPCYLIGETASPRRNATFPLYAGALIVSLLSLGILFLFLAERGVWWRIGSPPAQQMPGPAQAPVLPRLQLPSVMRQAKVDPAYSKEHPGWTRYQSDSLEFRLYREGDSIRAIQVIGLNGGNITEQFFHSFVRELSGGEPPPLTGTGAKDGFSVERGKTGNGTEYQVYRQTGDRRINAFVVALP